MIAAVPVFLAIHADAAAASTLRIACDEGAEGAEVIVNGKFKGECPIDVQVPAGTANVKVTKTVDGKPSLFEQAVRMGDGVTKRIEASFGAGGSSAGSVGTTTSTRSAPAKPDAAALDKQRYEIEMAQYRNSISSCLPRHAVELRRLTQQVQNVWRRVYSECRSEALGRGITTSNLRIACGDSTMDDDMDDPAGRVDHTPEYREYRQFESNAQRWCEKQFTRPQPPAGDASAARSVPDTKALDLQRLERVANTPARPSSAQFAPEPPATQRQAQDPASNREAAAEAQRVYAKLLDIYNQAKSGDRTKFAEIQKFALAGSSVAQNLLGACYIYGYGTEKDVVEATRWFVRSARQGNPNASSNLNGLRAAGYMVDVIEKSTK